MDGQLYPEVRLCLANQRIQQLYKELDLCITVSRAKEMELDNLLEACELFAREQTIKIECAEDGRWILYPARAYCDLPALTSGTCVRIGRGKLSGKPAIVRSHVDWLHGEGLPLGFEIGFVVEIPGRKKPLKRTFKLEELEVIPFVAGTQVAILGEAGKAARGIRLVKGICACGTIKTFRFHQLRNNKSRCCGCLRSKLFRQIKTVHGMCNHPLYEVWARIMNSCYMEVGRDYKYYGGKGVRVYEPWHDVQTFIEQVPLPPGEGYCLTRKDRNLDFQPGNIEWVRSTEFLKGDRNARSTSFQYKDQSLNLRELSDELGVSYSTIKRWTKKGMLSMATNTTELMQAVREVVDQMLIDKETITVKTVGAKLGFSVGVFCRAENAEVKDFINSYRRTKGVSTRVEDEETITTTVEETPEEIITTIEVERRGSEFTELEKKEHQLECWKSIFRDKEAEFQQMAESLEVSQERVLELSVEREALSTEAKTLKEEVRELKRENSLLRSRVSEPQLIQTKSQGEIAIALIASRLQLLQGWGKPRPHLDLECQLLQGLLQSLEANPDSGELIESILQNILYADSVWQSFQQSDSQPPPLNQKPKVLSTKPSETGLPYIKLATPYAFNVISGKSEISLNNVPTIFHHQTYPYRVLIYQSRVSGMSEPRLPQGNKLGGCFLGIADLIAIKTIPDNSAYRHCLIFEPVIKLEKPIDMKLPRGVGGLIETEKVSKFAHIIKNFELNELAS